MGQRRGRVAEQLDEQVRRRHDDRAERVAAQDPHRAERSDRHRRGQDAGDDDVRPAMGVPGEQLLRRGGDHDDLEDGPAEQLQHVDRGRQVGQPPAEQAPHQAPSTVRRSARRARPPRRSSTRRSPCRRRPRARRRRTTAGPPVASGSSTPTAPTGASSVTPRLPHRPSWSSQPSTFGAGSARVSGASAAWSRWSGSRPSSSSAHSLRRHDPVQVRRSATGSRPLSPVRPDSRVSVPAERTPAARTSMCTPGSARRDSGGAITWACGCWGLLEELRHPAVGERLAAGLAGRAVVQRRGRERHLANHVAADRARSARPGHAPACSASSPP